MDSHALTLELIGAADSGMTETLRAINVTSRGAMATGLYVGRQFVTTLAGEPPALYEPDENGTEHLILPVVEGGAVADLLAFRADKPERWWLRTGIGAVLGQDAIDKAEFFSDDDGPEGSLRVYRSPLSWLRSECQGCCILDWRVAACRLAGVREVVAEDLGIGEKIERAFVAPRGPSISVLVRRAA